MTTLKNLKGTAIQFLDADPVEYVGTWASSTAANTTHEECGAGGTATDTIVIGGQGSPSESPRTKDDTEIWNGSSWTEVANLNTDKKNQAGAGTSTSALSSSGQDPGNTNSPLVEQWNGSAWTEVAEVNTARRQLAGAGVSGTAALIFFGFGGSPETFTNVCESWNGSAWTEVGDTNTGRVRAGSFGTYTSAIGAGGSPDGSGNTANAESWNGSAWTEVGDLNTARRDMSSHGSGGSNTDGLIFAGYSGTANLASTESWNGTSWTEVNDLSTAFRNGFGSQQGSSTSAIAGLGFSTTYATQVEEWSFPAITATIAQEGDMWFNSSSSVLKGYGTAAGIPAATWASGGTLNAGHGYGTGFGSQTAAVCCFGGYPTHTNNTETYNGTAWTEVNEGNTARRNLGSFGILTSGLAFGGGPPFGVALTESWNGTSWTEVNDLPTTVYNNRGIGASSSSGISFGGVDAATPGKSKKAHEWDGSSWTAITDMGTIRESGMGANAGTATAALAFGGESPSLTANTELWNGSSWTELNNLNTARADAGGNGISTAALCFGGNPPSAPPYQATITEYWNGTSWTELNDLGTGIGNGIAPAGGSVSGMASGGLSNPSTQNTVSQEWTADAAVSTITTS